MLTKTITRCMILALIMVFMTAGAAFAGVGGSDVPTVPGTVALNETGVPFSFTITNQSNGVNAPHTVEIIDGSIVFTTTCGSSLSPGIPCLPGGQEAPNTISINPLTAIGTGGNCTGITFAVSPTANPNEYVFNASPLVPVLLGPADGSGASSTCTISFDVDVNLLPTHDSSGDPGLQTSQLARADMYDTTTEEQGSAAGSSTITVTSTPPPPLAVPTMDGWGMATFILFAGLASVYYLKRRRTEG